VLRADQSALQIICPKCAHKFLVEPNGGREPTVTKTTILLVDDARFFRELLVDLLKDRGANLLTADCAEDAWVLLHKHSIDLLIVDINLPDKNGLELIQDIRADRDLKEVRILCISGVYRKDDDAKMAINAGADDFISKSFKPDDLSERIDKLLQK
jgi:DNA-binding response OmpR family regulator